MKVIKSEYSAGTQSVNYQEIIESDNCIKVKLDIKSDSYDFQSYARIQAFSPTELKWNIVASIPYANMKTPPKLYYSSVTKDSEKLKTLMASKFAEDRNRLIEEAQLILNTKLTEDKPKPKKKTKTVPSDWPFPSSCAPEGVEIIRPKKTTLGNGNEWPFPSSCQPEEPVKRKNKP